MLLIQKRLESLRTRIKITSDVILEKLNFPTLPVLTRLAPIYYHFIE